MDTSTFLLTRSQLEERMESRRAQAALEAQGGIGHFFLSRWALPVLGGLLMNGLSGRSEIAPTFVRGLVTAGMGRVFQTVGSGLRLDRWLPLGAFKRWIK
jgi:hypothetical protein